MLGCRGKVQREGDVIHVIAEYVIDLTKDLKQVSGLDTPFPLIPGRGDEAKHPDGLGSRTRPPILVTVPGTSAGRRVLRRDHRVRMPSPINVSSLAGG